MIKEHLLFFFNKRGQAPERLFYDDEGLFFGRFKPGSLTLKNKSLTFFKIKITIKTDAYMHLKTLLSDICTSAPVLLEGKKPDRDKKMSLQYIGNVYRFVKSINLNLMITEN